MERGSNAGNGAGGGPAARVPRGDLLTVPNLLSLLRLLLVPVFVWAVVIGELGWAALVLMVAGITDLLDGKIARAFNLVSRIGQVLDTVADRLYLAAVVIALLAVGVIPWWVLVVLWAREAFILVLYPTVHRYDLPIPGVTFIGKTATFALLVAFPLLLLSRVEGWWSTPALVVGWAVLWWGMAFYWVAGGIYAWQIRHMAVRARRTV